MINFSVWKRKTTFLARSLLILACCLIGMLGGTPIASLANPCYETILLPETQVIAQNIERWLDEQGNWQMGWRNVRSEPRIANNKIGDVYNGYEGTIKRDSRGRYRVNDGTYIWYYIRWDRLNKDNRIVSRENGWIAGIKLQMNKYLTTIVEAKQKDAIAEALFNPPNRDKRANNYITADHTKHDYNDYGCNADWEDENGKLVYQGIGHAGWDVRTLYQAHDPAPYRNSELRNAKFYPLTDGKVINVTSDTIAIHDGTHTILYLHAFKVNPSIKAKAKSVPRGFISANQYLGRQGKKGNAKAEHVHIEVRKGEWHDALPTINETIDNGATIDPIPYLYRWVFPWDVNQDGQVDLSDLERVLRNWGTDKPQYDVNRDGIVNWADVAEVWNHLPAWFAPAARVSPAPLVDQTSLLPNYPNPFNPETWIPYSLAEDANVNLTIYNVKGTMVRHFDLGQQPAGHYIDRSKSIYWDGRNVLGEQVGSGVYLYHLQAGNYSATRRMVILK